MNLSSAELGGSSFTSTRSQSPSAARGGHAREDGRDLWCQGSVNTEKGLGAEDRTHTRTHTHTQTTEIKRGSKKRHAFIEVRELGLRVSLQMQTKDSEVRAHKPVS